MRQVKKEEPNYSYFVHNFHQGVVNHYNTISCLIKMMQ